MFRPIACAAVLLILSAAAAFCAEEKPKPEPPRIILVSPLAVSPSTRASFRIRGIELDAATEVKLEGTQSPVKVEIKSKAKSEAPKPFETKNFGDTELLINFELPADTNPAKVSLSIVTPKGTTAPVNLEVLPAASLADEKEPNDGFDTAQPLEPGKRMQGTISRAADVDVYRFSDKSGRSLRATVTAAQKGSPLDGVLTLFDERRHQLGTNDDADGKDPRLAFRVPADGTYYLVVSDANNNGSPMHAYQLTIEPDE
jgi:hypothetical protein